MRWKMNKLEYDENPKKYFKKAQEELVVYKIGFATEGDLFKAYDSPERYFAGKVGYDFRHLNKFFFPEGTSDMIIGEGHRAYSESVSWSCIMMAMTLLVSILIVMVKFFYTIVSGVMWHVLANSLYPKEPNIILMMMEKYLPLN